jgi:peroxiredoxin
VEKAIDFELPDHLGRPWRLSAEVGRGPVLVIFYRGDW